jgi:hypothetical protein
MLLHNQLRHVAAGRDERLQGKVLGHTPQMQQTFRLTGTRIGVELGT